MLLPGARDATSWDDDDTHQNNYESVGIVSDPNKVGKTGRNAAKRLAEDRDGEAARDDEGPTASHAGAKTKTTRDDTVAAQAVVGGDEVHAPAVHPALRVGLAQTAEADRTFELVRGVQSPSQGTQQGRLPAPRWPHEQDHFARRHAPRDA